MKGLNPEPAPIAVRLALPALLTAVLSLIALTPTDQFIMARLPILFAPIFVFHWSIFRPEGAGWAAIALLGLLLDLLSERLVGLTPLMLLSFHFMLFGLRGDLGALGFTARWIAFCVLLGLYCALHAALNAAILGYWAGGADVFGRWLVTCAAYPAVVWLYVQLDRRFLYPERRRAL